MFAKEKTAIRRYVADLTKVDGEGVVWVMWPGRIEMTNIRIKYHWRK